MVVVPGLLHANLVNGVEDIHPGAMGEVLGLPQPTGADHLQHLVPVLELPFAGVADDVSPGCPADPLADPRSVSTEVWKLWRRF